MYVRPFEILKRIGKAVYELALPPVSLPIDPVFHVSMLCQHILNEFHILRYDYIELDGHLNFVEESVVVLAKYVLYIRSRPIPII